MRKELIEIVHVWVHAGVPSPVSLILILELVMTTSLSIAILLWIIDPIALLRVRLVLLIVILFRALLLVLLPVVLARASGPSFILIIPVLGALRLVNDSWLLLALVVSISCRRVAGVACRVVAALLLVFVVLACRLVLVLLCCAAGATAAWIRSSSVSWHFYALSCLLIIEL